MPHIEEHISFEDLMAARCVIHVFFPELKNSRLFLHEENQSIIVVLTLLTSKPPTMMFELRELFLLVDTYKIKIHTQYIRSAANI